MILLLTSLDATAEVLLLPETPTEPVAFVEPLVELVAPLVEEVSFEAKPLVEPAAEVLAVIALEPVEDVPVLAKPLVLPVSLSELLEVEEGEEDADVLALLADWSLLAKPLVLPVWLSELLEVEDGEEDADVLALLTAWSLLATEPLVDEVPVLAVAEFAAFEEVSLLAKPLVLPVSLSELLEVEDGEEDADVFALLADWSLLAIEPLVDAVPVLEVAEFAAFEEVSLLAKPLVLPVWLSELLELLDGELLAEFETFTFVFWLLLLA